MLCGFYITDIEFLLLFTLKHGKIILEGLFLYIPCLQLAQ
jgi:hypothetical protein